MTKTLEGRSWAQKKLVDLSSDPKEYMAQEHAAFERSMQELWREKYGSTPYVRIVKDMGLQPARKWVDGDGVEYDEPERWEIFFQYREASDEKGRTN